MSESDCDDELAPPKAKLEKLSDENVVLADKAEICRKWIREFNTVDRRFFIREFLKECGQSDLEEISNLISQLRIPLDSSIPSSVGDPFLLLPPHLSSRILRFLDPVSLCRVSRVSRNWRALCDDPSLWRSLCQLQSSFRLSSEQAETEQIRVHTTEGGVVRWKSAFSERYRLWSNWHAGRCVVRTFTGHTQGVACVQMDDQRIVSGSSDTTIRIWDLKGDVNQMRSANLGNMTLNGHSSTVRCLHLRNNVLASGSNDFSIKVWNVDVNPEWSSIGCRKTMLGHTNNVRCLQMDGDSLLSGSYDSSLKLWSLTSGDCYSTFTGHFDAVLCLQFCDANSLAVSGSADCSIKSWDVRSGSTAMTIHNAHESAVTCVRFDSHRIVSGSVDRTIKMWDIRTGKCMQTIDWKLAEGHTGVVRCIQTDSWRLVSAADDRTVKVWNLQSGERLCTLLSHQDGVTCVQFNDRQIVSGSYDKTVKLWEFGVH